MVELKRFIEQFFDVQMTFVCVEGVFFCYAYCLDLEIGSVLLYILRLIHKGWYLNIVVVKGITCEMY